MWAKLRPLAHLPNAEKSRHNAGALQAFDDGIDRALADVVSLREVGNNIRGLKTLIFHCAVLLVQRNIMMVTRTDAHSIERGQKGLVELEYLVVSHYFVSLQHHSILHQQQRAQLQDFKPPVVRSLRDVKIEWYLF